MNTISIVIDQYEARETHSYKSCVCNAKLLFRRLGTVFHDKVVTYGHDFT